MEFSKVLKKSIVGAAFAGLAVSSFATHAAIITGLFIQGQNQIEDTDLERVVDSSGAVKTSGNFAVGDTIQSILRFNTVNTNTISDTYGAPYQLNAYTELTIAGITDPNLDGDNNINTGLVDIAFAPSGNLGGNVFTNLYERTSALQPGFDQTVAPAVGIANVQAETLIAQLGTNGIDDFWTTRSLLDIGAAAGLQPGDPQVAQGIFGLTCIAPCGLPIKDNAILGADGNLHDVVGNSSAYQLAPGADSGWLVSSNTSANFMVPEPAPLAMIGLGLTVLGLIRRRSKV